MTKLNQILAIEKGVRSKVDRDVTDRYQMLQKPQLLVGVSRTYTPKDDEGDELPAESQQVQAIVEPILAETAKDLTRLFDVTLTKDTANMVAAADIVVDGATLASDIPVSYLLFLEKQLTDLFTVVRRLPTLDPAEAWTYDEARGVYVTPVVQSTRTKKVPRNHVLAPATDKHPAQVQMYHEDQIVGTWSTVKFSGAIPVDMRKTLEARVTKLQEAVKYAREQANSSEITDQTIGESLFNYLLEDL